MGALSLPKPRNQNKYGRDPESPSERLRTKTNYQKSTGYAPLFHAMVADLPRLSRGASCTHLILAILSLQDRAEKDGRTPSFSLEEWADLAKCDAKEIQRNRDYLKARKMAECGVDTRRLYSFRLRPEAWEALEDYKTWQAKQLAKDEPVADDAATDDVDESKPGNWRMSKPVTVARGKSSKPLTPDCGMSRIIFKVPFETPAGVDIAFFSAVKAGDVFITPIVTLQAGVQKANSEASKQVNPIAEDMGVLGNGESKANKQRRTVGETHPRASELCQLFDPLLGKSAAVLLAMDRASLLSACEAVADCDHDYLVQFVTQRAERSPIKKPQYVRLICADALASWRASKILDGTRLENKSPLSDKGKRVADNLRRIHGK